MVSGARPLQRRRCDALDEAGQRDARELVTAAGFEQRWAVSAPTSARAEVGRVVAPTLGP